MKTIKITLFVGDAAKAAQKIEKTAYGYRGRADKWVNGKVSEDDFDAIDMIETAINLLYSCRGEEVTIELPSVLRCVVLKKAEYEKDAADPHYEDDDDLSEKELEDQLNSSVARMPTISKIQL